MTSPSLPDAPRPAGRPSGLFISFEGIDYSGKSTQLGRCARLIEKRGLALACVREPGGTVVSERVRSILLDPDIAGLDPTAELLLFAAARVQLIRETIAPALAQGAIVLADRFHDSTTAYQGYGRGIDLDAIASVQRIAIRGIFPVLTLVYDIDYDERERRRISVGRTSDRMEGADRFFFERVRAGYHTIAAREPQRVRIIDGMQDEDAVFRATTNILLPFLFP